MNTRRTTQTIAPWSVALAFAVAMAGAMAAPSSADGSETRQDEGLRIVVLEGEDGVNIIGQATAVPTLVEVRDRNDLPVSGASVVFLLGEGGTATLNAGLSQVAATTNALGQAAVTVNPIANGVVQLQVSAAFQGQTATAVVAQTNFATLAEAAAAGAGATVRAGGGGGTPSAGGAASGGAGGGLGTGAIVGIAAAAVGAVIAGVTLGGGGDTAGTGPGGVVGGSTANGRPVAALSVTPDGLGMAGLTEYRFDGGGSSDPDRDALTYHWDFGDGGRGTGVTATHVYDATGTHTVTLTVSDGTDQATATGTVTVDDLSGVFVTQIRGTVGGRPDPRCDLELSMEVAQNGTMLDLEWQERIPAACPLEEDRWSSQGTVTSSNNFICPCGVTISWPGRALRGRSGKAWTRCAVCAGSR